MELPAHLSSFIRPRFLSHVIAVGFGNHHCRRIHIRLQLRRSGLDLPAFAGNRIGLQKARGR